MRCATANTYVLHHRGVSDRPMTTSPPTASPRGLRGVDRRRSPGRSRSWQEAAGRNRRGDERGPLMRHDANSQGAPILVVTKVSGAPRHPGSGNVIVIGRGGFPRSCRPCSNEGFRAHQASRPASACLSETVAAADGARNGDIGHPARRHRQGQSRGRHRQLPVLRPAGQRAQYQRWSCVPADAQKLALAKQAVEGDAWCG